MTADEKIARIYPTKEEMSTRVARFRNLKGFDGGLADSNMPEAKRLLFNVIGFQPPPVEGMGAGSPVGALAARMSPIKISEGFNLGYCEALPGKGPMMHNHDTNETFCAITGRWRASWEVGGGEIDYVDLHPLDVISFPPGVIRRFENISDGPKDQYSLLMFVIAGDAPTAEFTKESLEEIDRAGLLDMGQTDSSDAPVWVGPHLDPSEFTPAQTGSS